MASSFSCAYGCTIKSRSGPPGNSVYIKLCGFSAACYRYFGNAFLIGYLLLYEYLPVTKPIKSFHVCGQLVQGLPHSGDPFASNDYVQQTVAADVMLRAEDSIRVFIYQRDIMLPILPVRRGGLPAAFL